MSNSTSSETSSVVSSQDWEDFGSQYSHESSRRIVKQVPTNVLVLHRRKQIGTRNGVTKKGLHVVKGIYKNYKIKVHSTPNYPNSIIRNAITGTGFKFESGDYARVGTFDEDLFFSVLLSTGEAGQSPALLFYDNPEQYERHMEELLPQDGKVEWMGKYVSAKDTIERRKRANKKHTIIS